MLPALATTTVAGIWGDIWRRRRIMVVYFVTVAILFADMKLIAPNLIDISEGE